MKYIFLPLFRIIFWFVVVFIAVFIQLPLVMLYNWVWHFKYVEPRVIWKLKDSGRKRNNISIKEWFQDSIDFIKTGE